MKNRLIIALAFVALALASCEKENVTPQGYNVSVTAEGFASVLAQTSDTTLVVTNVGADRLVPGKGLRLQNVGPEATVTVNGRTRTMKGGERWVF